MSRSVGADCVFEWIVGPKCRHGRRWNWVLNKRRAVCEHKNKARANRANPNLKLTWETRDMDMKPDRYVWLWNYEINRTWTWSVRRTLRHDVARHANKDWKKTQTKYTQGAIGGSGNTWEKQLTRMTSSVTLSVEHRNKTFKVKQEHNGMQTWHMTG